jgi:hypothetical protein
MSAAMRLSETVHAVPDPFEFATDIIATALVALGVKQADAVRLAKTAMQARKEGAGS